MQPPHSTPPFRLAGHPVHALCRVQLAAARTDLQGLADQRRLGLGICFRDHHSSYLHVTVWHKTFPIILTTHEWLRFASIRNCSHKAQDWNQIIYKSLLSTATPFSDISICFLPRHDEAIQSTAQEIHLIPHWKRDTWTPTISRMDFYRLYRAFKHPESSSITSLIGKSLGYSPMPAELKKELDSIHCFGLCSDPGASKETKALFPPEAKPNVVVSLDIMPHKIQNRTTDILVMIDHSDMFLKLKVLQNSTAIEAFNSFYSHWISTFDAPIYVRVDRESNLAAVLMKYKLHELESQLCPIQTEAPWGIGLNERSHRYLYKSIDRLTLQRDYDTGNNHEVLLADVEIGWNYAQINNNILPHYHRFCVMPRFIGALEECSRLFERVALMHRARQDKNTLQAIDLVSRALDIRHRKIVPFQSIAINEKAWFHLLRQGWRTVKVAGIDRPTILVEHDGKIYPTHDSRVRPHFGEKSTPPPLHDDQFVQDRPHSMTTPRTTQRALLSDILNPVFVSFHEVSSTETGNFIDIPCTSYSILINHMDKFDIDSDSVFLTVIKVIKTKDPNSDSHRKKFASANREEIELMPKDAVTPISLADVPKHVSVQALKWVLAIKTSSEDSSATHHCS